MAIHYHYNSHYSLTAIKVQLLNLRGHTPCEIIMDVASECSTKKNSMSFTQAVILSFFLQSYTQHGFSLEFSGLLLTGFWWHTLSGCWVFDWGILVAPVQLLQYIQPFQHTTMCQLCLPHWHPHLWNGTSDLILNTGRQMSNVQLFDAIGLV